MLPLQTIVPRKLLMRCAALLLRRVQQLTKFLTLTGHIRELLCMFCVATLAVTTAMTQPARDALTCCHCKQSFLGNC